MLIIDQITLIMQWRSHFLIEHMVVFLLILAQRASIFPHILYSEN